MSMICRARQSDVGMFAATREITIFMCLTDCLLLVNHACASVSVSVGLPTRGCGEGDEDDEPRPDGEQEKAGESSETGRATASDRAISAALVVRSGHLP